MDTWDVVVGFLWVFSGLALYVLGFISGEYRAEMKVLRLLFKIMDDKNDTNFISAAYIIASSLKKKSNASKNHPHPK